MVRLLRDRGILQARLLASLDVMLEQAEVDAEQRAAIGFCFGGLCVLDMARVNATAGRCRQFSRHIRATRQFRRQPNKSQGVGTTRLG